MDNTLTQNPLPPYVYSLLLPVAEDTQLLLPHVTVAEVLMSAEVESEEGPPWYSGRLLWRGEELPLVSFAGLNGDHGELFAGKRYAVLNTLSGDQVLPFLAVAILAPPRQLRVMAEEIDLAGEVATGPAEYCKARVAGELVSIPHLDYIEQQIREIWQ